MSPVLPVPSTSSSFALAFVSNTKSRDSALSAGYVAFLACLLFFDNLSLGLRVHQSALFWCKIPNSLLQNLAELQDTIRTQSSSLTSKPSLRDQPATGLAPSRCMQCTGVAQYCDASCRLGKQLPVLMLKPQAFSTLRSQKHSLYAAVYPPLAWWLLISTACLHATPRG